PRWLGHGSLLRPDDRPPLVTHINMLVPTIDGTKGSARSLLAPRWWRPPELLPAPDGFSNSRPRPSGRRKARSCMVVGYFESAPSVSSARLKRLFQSGSRMV